MRWRYGDELSGETLREGETGNETLSGRRGDETIVSTEGETLEGWGGDEVKFKFEFEISADGCDTCS